MARTFRRPCVKVELHHLPSDEVVGHEHTPESLARHLGRAEELAEETGAADTAYRAGLDDDGLAAAFPASPSPSCRWCDFVRVCPEALSVLANEAMRDVSFLLRPAHNEQVAKILGDPEASMNDKGVALAFLRNSEIAAQPGDTVYVRPTRVPPISVETTIPHDDSTLTSA